MTLLLFVMIVINKPSLNKNVSQQHKRQTIQRIRYNISLAIGPPD